MNKIIVELDKINNYSDSDIEINNNKIIFKKNGDYTIEYINCSNVNINYVIKDDAYIKLFEYSINNKINLNNTYDINKNSNLLLFKFYNNDSVLENLIFNLNEFNANIKYCFSNISLGNEEYNIVVNHNKSNTFSNIINKSIVINSDKLHFNIDSNLKKGNINCVLNQETRIITNNNCDAIIKPNMYIEENNVEARHASIISEFNENDLFYLMTRGIAYSDAIKLLAKGFILSNLVVDMEHRERILNIINKYWR